MGERITAAAIRLNGEVYTGCRHQFILEDLIGRDVPDVLAGEKGFTTDAGRFVDRFEAAAIALRAGQIARLPSNGRLSSEMVLPLVEDAAVDELRRTRGEAEKGGEG